MNGACWEAGKMDGEIRQGDAKESIARLRKRSRASGDLEVIKFQPSCRAEALAKENQHFRFQVSNEAQMLRHARQFDRPRSPRVMANCLISRGSDGVGDIAPYPKHLVQS